MGTAKISSTPQVSQREVQASENKKIREEIEKLDKAGKTDITVVVNDNQTAKQIRQTAISLNKKNDYRENPWQYRLIIIECATTTSSKRTILTSVDNEEYTRLNNLVKQDKRIHDLRGDATKVDNVFIFAKKPN